MKRTKIILDCDTGIDDAIAIIIAAKNPSIELLGVTTVNGNVPLDTVTKNTLDVLNWIDADIPVYKGCRNSIIGRKNNDSNFHGIKTLADIDFPLHNNLAHKKNAVNYIIDTLLNSEEKITLVATGPMTNIAIALRMQPNITDKIEKIIFMGGSPYLGNVTPAAEFNIFQDPEAAHICCNSNVAIYMIGFDITTQTKCFPEIMHEVSKIKNCAADLFTKIITYYNATQKSIYGFDGAALNDPHTIAYIVDPSFLVFRKMHVDIDLQDGCSLGRTNCDIYGRSDKCKNVNVAVEVDVDKFWNIIYNCLKEY